MAWGATSDPQEFRRAVEWFEGRIPMTRPTYDQMGLQWRRYAFTIANVAQTSMVAEVHQRTIDAIRSGQEFAAYRKDLLKVVQNQWIGEVGRPAFRAETVYRNALQHSYNTGRHRQMTAEPIASARPMWIFDAMLDMNTTDICIARNQIRKPNSDPFWKRNYPPLHHRCRSGVRTDRRRDTDVEAGDTLPDDAPPAQAGWGYEPRPDEWEPDPTKWPVTLQKAYGKKQKGMPLWKPPAASKKLPTPPAKPSTPKIKKPKPKKTSPKPVPDEHLEPKITPPKAPKPKTPQQTYMTTKISDATGSNPGGVYRGIDGAERYVKIYDDPMQAYGEHLANDLYRRMGISAPESVVFHLDDGTVAYASRMLKNAKTIQQTGIDEAGARRILNGYMSDVWTGNWDAVGMNLDNVVQLPGGAIYRIDNGGTFFMRATNGRKPTDLLTKITEFENFANRNVNPAYASIWKSAGYTGPMDIRKQLLRQLDDIDELATAVGNQWDDVVFQALPNAPKEARRKLSTLLTHRTNAIRGLKPRLAAVPKPVRAGVVDWAEDNAIANHGFKLQQGNRNVQVERELNEQWAQLIPDDAERSFHDQILKEWTASYSENDYQKALRATVRSIATGEDVPAGLARLVDRAAIEQVIATRRARWAQHAARIGLTAPPEEFVAYRGVHGIDFLEDVARAWDSGEDTIRIRSYNMASWSLDPDNPYSRSEVVFKRTFSIDETFADQFLDDSSMWSTYIDEHEIISMATTDNAHTTGVRDVTVNFAGRRYTYEERDTFIAEFRRAAKSAGRQLDF